jgi:hypothetical protein
MNKFEGKVVISTGARRRIGFPIAERDRGDKPACAETLSGLVP